jgi:hypothetical protein
VYRYHRSPLLLVLVITENKDILCVLIYTSMHGQKYLVFNCLFIFIPATSLDDTKQYLIIKQQI